MKKKTGMIKYMRGSLSALLLGAGIAFGASIGGFALPVITYAQDPEQFAITEIRFDTGTVSPGERINVKAVMQERYNDLRHVILEVQVNPGKTELIYLAPGENEVPEGSVTIGDNWSNGIHRINRVSIEDKNGNVTEYNTEGAVLGEFTVTGSSQAYDVPVVSSVTYDKNELRIGDFVHISVAVTHVSDLEEMIVTFTGGNGETHSVYFEDGVTELDEDLSEWSEGTYNVTGIYVMDKSGNKEYYEEHDNLGEVETSPLFISNAYPDTQGPTVTSVTFTKGTDVPGIAHVTAHDPSGVSYVLITLSDPKGETYDVYAFPDDEGNISGNIYADDTWYNGRYTVAKVTATDTLGNTIEYSDDTGHRIRNTETFLLSGSKEDREAPILRSIDIKGTNLKPGDKGEIRFRLLDKSDIWEHSVSIYRTDSNDPFKTFTPETSDDGNYYCEFTVNDQWYNGEYDIRINTGDSLGNNDNIMTGLKLRVSGSAEDYHPPEVISAVVDKTEAVPGDVLEFTVEAKDASRIRYVQGELAYIDEDGFPEPAAFEDQLFIMSREDDGLYHFNVAIDDKWKNGEHVLLIHSSDEWGNEEFDMETDVTVSISDSLAHQEGPLIKTITFDRHEAQPGDTVKVTATAEDPAGIDFIKLRLYPDISPEEEYYYFNLGDDLDLFPDDDGTYTGYITITHSWKNATYFVATAEAQDNLGNISYDNVDFDTYEEDYFTVSGATGEESSLRITSVKFDKEKVRFGEEMTMTATVEGTGEVGVIEVDLVLDDEDFYSSVWSRKILLYPAGDGVVKGSFPVKRTDHYWKDGHRYGIMQAYLMDTVYSTKSYSDKTDLDAYEIEDMRNIETNTFTVDVFADPVINPADYTAVDAALENIPEDLRDYTDDSILILRQAVDAVDRNKTEREQPVVDNYAKSINLAIEALEFKPADYSQVDEAIKSIPADLSLYTDESVTALRRAENNVVRDKRINEQEVVNGYAGALKAAIEGLKLRPADYKAVDDITKTVPGDLTPYTEASLAALRESLGKAERGLLIDKQDQVDTFAKDIEAAIAGLELRPADYSAVDEVRNKIPADLTLYTDESAAALREALDKIEGGLLIDKQDKVDTFAKDIEAAIDGLELRPADYSAVDEVISKVPVDLTPYTDESVAVLRESLDKLERGLLIDKQDQVDTFAKDIEAAIAGLQKKETEKPEKKEDPVKQEDPVKEEMPVKESVPVKKDTPVVKSTPAVTSMPVVTTQKPAPVTGDKNDTLLWSSAAVLSLAGIGAAAVIIRKRRHNK